MESLLEVIDRPPALQACYGPSAQAQWAARCQTARRDGALDVVLLTHPRDEADIPRMFPWAAGLSAQQRFELMDCLRPTFGEIIEAGGITIGILLLPMLAQDILDPRKRAACRTLLETDGLAKAASLGARHICLGGLTGALSNYGRRLMARASALGMQVTTGHAVTAVSVVRQYAEALAQSGLGDAQAQVAVLGVGSVGSGVCRLLASSPRSPRPAGMLLVDTVQQQDRLEHIAGELRRGLGIPVAIEVLEKRTQLPASSACYTRANVIISAVSTPYILDIDCVRPGTILIDDSQPYCWDRDAAWHRVCRQADIVPCDAGLVDADSIGYRSFFPFDFADAGPAGSAISWSCLAEGLLRRLRPALPANVGETDLASLLAYDEAFDDVGFRIPKLQCGSHILPEACLQQVALTN